MKILDKYIAKQILLSIFSVLGVLVVVVGVLDLVDEIKKVNDGYSLTLAFLYVFLNIPQNIYEVLPIATLMGSLIGLSKLSSTNELNAAIMLNAKVVTENENPVDIKTLISLIYNAKFVIANDTGPAHIASHLDKKGLVLFGNHTSAKKVSIENYNFKALTVKNLKDLNVNEVLREIKLKLN